MNRRGFLGRLAAVCAAFTAIPALVKAKPVPSVPPVGDGMLTFKGIPLVFDEHCPSNCIYFLSRKGPYVVGEIRGLK